MNSFINEISKEGKDLNPKLNQFIEILNSDLYLINKEEARINK